MDIRTPDNYTTETLLQHSSRDTSRHESDISCRELELAMLESMEEVWAKEAECAALWASFQPFLVRLKRVGHYDEDLQKIYDLLSVMLYKFAYQVEDFLSEETYRWIEKHLKTIRLSSEERTQLTKAFDHLRNSQPPFAEQSSIRPRFEP